MKHLSQSSQVFGTIKLSLHESGRLKLAYTEQAAAKLGIVVARFVHRYAWWRHSRWRRQLALDLTKRPRGRRCAPRAYVQHEDSTLSCQDQGESAVKGAPTAAVDDLTTYTPEQVAAIIGGSVWWVKEMARQKRVSHLRLGRSKIVFRRSDIVALLDSRAVAATAGPTPTDPVDEATDADTVPTLADIARSAGVTRRGAARLRNIGA